MAIRDSDFEDFPSLITAQVLPRVTDPSPAKRMIGRLMSCIRSSGRSKPGMKPLESVHGLELRSRTNSGELSGKVNTIWSPTDHVDNGYCFIVCVSLHYW